MKKVVLSILAISALVFTSCSDEGTPIAPEATVETPENYEFTDADGNSTVSYSGQEARLAMGAELKSKLGTEVSLKDLTTMFKDGKGFSSEDLNNSGKKIRSTVASATNSVLSTSDAEAFRANIDGWFTDYVNNVLPNKEQDASEGVAGALKFVHPRTGTERAVYVNAKGFEANQLFAKGAMIGGVILDQVANKYVSEKYLTDAIDAHEAGTVYKEGKNYTKLEHGWDEAYGYVFGKVEDKNVFLGKYLGEVAEDPDFKDIKTMVETAFKRGRQAIVVKNYTVMKEQAKIIREQLSKAVAIRCVFYMMISTDANKATGLRFHALSEAYGFLNALQFAHANGVQVGTNVQRAMVNFEGENGLWEVIKSDNKTLTETSEYLASLYGFTVKQAKSTASEAETN